MATKIEGWANGNPAYPGRHHSFTDLNSGVGVKATLVIGDERVFTESEVRELIKAGNAMSVAMRQYEMDVDDDPPQKHRDMMNAWERAVIRFSNPD